MADSNGVNRARWVDLASSDAAASRDFYAKLFGWEIEVDPDPQYGGYALARIDGRDVAGIGPKMSAGGAHRLVAVHRLRGCGRNRKRR